jgi:hypothetical protein
MLGLRDGLAELGYRQDEQVALGARAPEGHEDRLDATVRQLLRGWREGPVRQRLESPGSGAAGGYRHTDCVHRLVQSRMAK